MATYVEEVLRGDSKGRKGPEAMKMSGGESASGNAPTPNQDASASSQGAFSSPPAQPSHLGVTGAQIEWEETRKEDEMEVEKIWYGRLAKMQKIHERELQELR